MQHAADRCFIISSDRDGRNCLLLSGLFPKEQDFRHVQNMPLELLSLSPRYEIVARREKTKDLDTENNVPLQLMGDTCMWGMGKNLYFHFKLLYATVFSFIISEPRAKLAHCDCNLTWGEITIKMQWNVAQWFSSPNNVLMFLWINSDTADRKKMTDGLTELPLCESELGRPRIHSARLSSQSVHLSVSLWSTPQQLSGKTRTLRR